MAQCHKLDIEDTAVVLSDTANTDGIALRQLAVQTGLGPVGLIKDLDGGLRCRGAAKLLGLGDVAAHGLLDLLGTGRGTLSKAEGHTSSVAIQDWDTVASRGDTKLLLVLERGGVCVDSSENLLSLGLKLVLLSGNEGDNVVDDVHAANTGVASARDGLHRDHRDGVNLAKACLKGSKRDDEADDCAIAVANQEALLQAERLALVRDEVQMVEVDSRDDEGHERIASVVLGVGEDGDVGVLELLLDVTGHIAVETAEDDVTVGELGSLALAHNQVANLGGDGARLLPSDGVTVLLAGRS